MMSRFTITDTPLDGLKIIERKLLADDRGFLTRMFCASELTDIGWTKPIAQINHTLTKLKGAIRGMHFQKPPFQEAKLVNCIRGEVFDVAVDLRKGSSTFLQWYGQILSAGNCRSLLIPEGFAHGFQALRPDSELVYFHSNFYNSDAEGGWSPFDPAIGIEWPLPVSEISQRDTSHAAIDNQYEGLVI